MQVAESVVETNQYDAGIHSILDGQGAPIMKNSEPK